MVTHAAREETSAASISLCVLILCPARTCVGQTSGRVRSLRQVVGDQADDRWLLVESACLRTACIRMRDWLILSFNLSYPVAFVPMRLYFFKLSRLWWPRPPRMPRLPLVFPSRKSRVLLAPAACFSLRMVFIVSAAHNECVRRRQRHSHSRRLHATYGTRQAASCGTGPTPASWRAFRAGRRAGRERCGRASRAACTAVSRLLCGRSLRTLAVATHRRAGT